MFLSTLKLCWTPCRSLHLVHTPSSAPLNPQPQTLNPQPSTSGCAHLQERLAALQHKITPKERGTLLWAYGNLRCYPGQDLMEALCSEPTHNIQAYDSQVQASSTPLLAPSWLRRCRGGDLRPTCKLCRFCGPVSLPAAPEGSLEELWPYSGAGSPWRPIPLATVPREVLALHLC